MVLKQNAKGAGAVKLPFGSPRDSMLLLECNGYRHAVNPIRDACPIRMCLGDVSVIGHNHFTTCVQCIPTARLREIRPT